MAELKPRVVVWEYTLACDSNCIHCGSDAKFPRERELNRTESLGLVDQISDVGFKLVILSGGEPTLRKDWIETAERIKYRGMEFGIISNALKWNTQTIDSLVSLAPYSVGFSVDGEREMHNYLRGVNGSHEKIFSNIKALKKKEITVCAITSVNKLNLNQLPNIRDRLNSYGVDAWQIQLASPMGRMKDKKELLLNAIEHYKLGEFIIESRQSLVKMNIQAGDCIGYYGLLEPKIRDYRWRGCGAGIEALGIDSDGKVRGCLSLRDLRAIEGNIRESSLRDIWSNPHKFKYTRGFSVGDLGPECKECEYGTECGGGCQSQSTSFFNEFHRAPYCFFRHEKSGKI